jgi:GMP reductase
MRIEEEIKVDYCDVLIRPKRSVLESRKEVELERTFQFPNGRIWTGIPIVASNMDTTGTIEMGKVLSDNGMITCLSKHGHEQSEYSSLSSHEKNNMALSFGSQDREMLLNDAFAKEFTFDWNFFCLDVANGYTQKFVDFIKEVREKWPTKILIAGNVVTSEMTEALILAGADIIKIGIGPGSVCTTRKVAGVGYPQLSAVIECADAAHGLDGFIMADGGCQSPGDVAKAFGAGADFVMLGGLLAGHEECAGEVVTDEAGDSYKVFYGMSSTTAMDKHNGGVATYRASEGKTVKVPYRGPVSETIQQILGGVRSACTYTGARNIKQLPKCTTFVRVNHQLNTVFGDK